MYARISSDTEGRALGVTRQLEDCRRLADSLGWPVAQEYIDNDLSAYSGKRRPAYEQLLADLANGLRDAVICYHVVSRAGSVPQVGCAVAADPGSGAAGSLSPCPDRIGGRHARDPIALSLARWAEAPPCLTSSGIERQLPRGARRHNRETDRHEGSPGDEADRECQPPARR